MLSTLRQFWHAFTSRSWWETNSASEILPLQPPDFSSIPVDSSDPVIAYFKERPNAVELDQVDLDSPALRTMRQAGVKVIAPLVVRGELVGLLNLGVKLNTLNYTPDDLMLLNNLVTQAAPAVRVAQLAELQKIEALKTERIEQELRVARLIQQTLLPKRVPNLPGWSISTYYQPARAVGGDFYDFIDYEDGRIGFVIGDVTDKGMPAALLMATTRATLRSMAQRFVSPGEVLRQTNEALCPDVPPSMFVTCMFALLDMKTGRMVYANAGHNLPYRCSGEQLSELKATGMPLGLLPGMKYEEFETILQPGERIFLYSDGLVEAHNPQRDMFGNPRLEAGIRECPVEAQDLIHYLLSALAAFTGQGWEQEDDITVVLIEKSAG